MATLTLEELAAARAAKNRDGEVVTWLRADINAAVQAIEDLLEQVSTRTAISNAIEAAAPTKFTNSQKRRLFLLVCALKARAAGINV